MLAVPPPASKPEAGELLAWYDRHRRDLPWRAKAGVPPDPYRVWLSEIMLQQTTVAAVKPFYERFLQRFPTVARLAEAPVEEVMQAWAGLGYYSRARNLHACAKAVAEGHGGRFPDTEAGLRRLPGIGAYTAAAIAAIAFDRPTAAVDGNVERVVSRLFLVETPLPKAKPMIRNLAAGLVPAERPGDFAQALMDLGATICTPKRPACAVCPWLAACRTSAWSPDYDASRALRDAPLEARWRRLPGLVRHTFTHFPLELTVLVATVAAATPAPAGMRFAPRRALAGAALPGVMRKVLAHADVAPAAPAAGEGDPHHIRPR